MRLSVERQTQIIVLLLALAMIPLHYIAYVERNDLRNRLLTREQVAEQLNIAIELSYKASEDRWTMLRERLERIEQKLNGRR